MLIGELASATGVTAKTLRFYEDQALLPEPGRRGNGYRDYPASMVGRVRFVKDAQAAGFTLGEIGQILAIRDDGEPPCTHVATVVAQRLAQVEERIRELELLRAQLGAIATRAERFAPDDCDGYCGLIPAR